MSLILVDSNISVSSHIAKIELKMTSPAQSRIPVPRARNLLCPDSTVLDNSGIPTAPSARTQNTDKFTYKSSNKQARLNSAHSPPSLLPNQEILGSLPNHAVENVCSETPNTSSALNVQRANHHGSCGNPEDDPATIWVDYDEVIFDIIDCYAHSNFGQEDGIQNMALDSLIEESDRIESWIEEVANNAYDSVCLGATPLRSAREINNVRTDSSWPDDRHQ